MPKRDKIGDENIFCESQASIQTPNLTFTLLLLSAYERQTISAKVSNLTLEKGVNGELRYVCLRDSEQMQGFRICGNKSVVNVRHNNCIEGACQ
jgi:hypothetical protein